MCIVDKEKALEKLKTLENHIEENKRVLNEPEGELSQLKS